MRPSNRLLPVKCDDDDPQVDVGGEEDDEHQGRNAAVHPVHVKIWSSCYSTLKNRQKVSKSLLFFKCCCVNNVKVLEVKAILFQGANVMN